MVFILFAVRHQADKPPEGRVAWSFAVGEALKMLFTIVLLVVALGVFHAVFFSAWPDVLSGADHADRGTGCN
ncbi:hypothetical protein DZS_01840 [Dickeya ananatis]